MVLNRLKTDRADHARPDYLGQAAIRGVKYELRGWLTADQHSINLVLEPMP